MPASKRKTIVESTASPPIEEEGSDGEDFDELDVDFEWFAPSAEIDFDGIKGLIKQLLDVDSPVVDLSALTDLILDQPLLGSTVKVDGKETDAYAFLSVVNLQIHREKPCIQSLVQYLRGRANSNPELKRLAELLSQPEMPAVGLILTERLINVPAEVSPPMYSMLLEEIQWALEEKEPYSFTHYLILSKVYTEVASALDEEDDRPKKKKKASSQNTDVLYFHPEDEILQRHALCHGRYEYTTPRDDGHSDSKRAFQELGIRPQSSAILLEAASFEGAIKEMTEHLKPPT